MGAALVDVTLFIPGLMGFEDKLVREIAKHSPRLPALELLLSRAEKTSTAMKNYDQVLFQLFHLDRPEPGDYPAGALAHYLHRGEKTNHWYMRADPVYLQPNRDHIVLLGNEMLDIGTQEAGQLVHDINDTYSDTSWTLTQVSCREWVIEQREPIRLSTFALDHVVGKNINDYLPHGDRASAWNALMNELQMLLHSHPLNRERESKGLPFVNSLWFWGAGQLPVIHREKPKHDFAQCWSENTTALALAKLHNIAVMELPADAQAWMGQMNRQHTKTPGRQLLVIDQLHQPMVQTDPYAWWQALATLEAQWFNPLLNALRNNTIRSLTLFSDCGECFYLTRSLAQRWWRRVKAIA